MARRALGSPVGKLKRPEREPETGGLPGEPSQRQLLHCLRDLAGLQSFPARCVGRTLPEVAVAGIETAQALVPSELAYLRLKAGPETLAEAGLLNGKPACEADLRSLLNALSPLLDGPGGVVTTVVWPDGNAPLQAFVIPLGFYGQCGSLMIASCEAQFPGELQVAVLRSAASLIATAAESARLLVETREAQTRHPSSPMRPRRSRPLSAVRSFGAGWRPTPSLVSRTVGSWHSSPIPPGVSRWSRLRTSRPAGPKPSRRSVAQHRWRRGPSMAPRKSGEARPRC